jgi:hypothetical protein
MTLNQNERLEGHHPFMIFFASLVPEATLSAESLRQAKDWLESCERSHEKCSRIRDVPLPSRLMLIKRDSFGFRVSLRETQNESGRYLCLSHC